MKWYRTHASNRSNINNAPRTTLCHTHSNFPARYVVATLVYSDNMVPVILFKLVCTKRVLKNTCIGHQNINRTYIFFNLNRSCFNARLVTHINRYCLAINLFGYDGCPIRVYICNYNLTSIICEQTDTSLAYSAGPPVTKTIQFCNDALTVYQLIKFSYI